MDKSQTAETIPGWDGNPRGWRRYQREVSWYVMGCKPSVRKYLAPRLISKLTGPARLLAMGWSQQDFQGVDGINLFMTKLGKSPLVRRKLPNTAAVMQQYFSFRREPNEAIPHFLVKESLHYEEFVEALQLLKQDKEGKVDGIFLPPVEESDEDEDDDGSQAPSQSQRSEKKDPKKEKKKDYKPLPTEDPDEPSSPLPPRSSASASRPAASSSMDSFILEQLQGWRLLMAAALSPEEWRSILASTNNRLDYVSVMSALEILYDEHFSRGRQHQQHPGQLHQGRGTHYFHMATEESEWEEDDGSFGSWWMAPAQHEEDYAAPSDLQPAEPGGEDNEAMAMDGKRSWSQAQRATQVMKKDRGFGAAASSKPEGCFACGSPHHLVRDCPDRHAPMKGGGKWKAVHWAEADEEWDDGSYAMAALPFKGRKGKGKGKNFHVVDEVGNVYAFLPHKGMGKGKPQSKNRGNVNAYSAEAYDYHGLEFEIQTAEGAPKDGSLAACDKGGAQIIEPTPAHGMMDCGATCSAGPERSIQNLVHAILAKDSAAKITINGQNRPRFRYGSGKWGKAEYHLQVQSSITGRIYSAYALPDPEEIKQPWFKDHMLVPVLVGMDFLRGNGMIVDYSDGLSVCAKLEGAKPVKLPMNHKEHYLIDVVDFLCNGETNQDGNPEIQIISSVDESLQSLEIQLHDYEMFPLTFDMDMQPLYRLHEDKSSRSNDFFMSFWKRHQVHQHGQQDGLMGNSLLAPFNSTVKQPEGHGTQEDRHQGGEPRLGSLYEDGPTRSPQPNNTMALHGIAYTNEVAIKPVRSVATLRNMCSEDGVRADEGFPGKHYESAEPNQCPSSSQRTSRGDAEAHATKRGIGPSHDREGHKSDSLGDSHGGVQEDMASGNGKGCKREGHDPEAHGRSWQTIFEQRGLRRTSPKPSSRKSVTFERQLGASQSRPRGQHHGLPDPRGEGQDHGDCQGACPGKDTSKQAGRRGVGTRLQSSTGSSVIEEMETHKSLPLRIGKAGMNLIHHLQEGLRSSAAELVYGERPVVWEMFCSPQSELTNCCQKEGLNSIRIGLSSGFDLYKKESYEALKEEATSSQDLGEYYVQALLRLDRPELLVPT